MCSLDWSKKNTSTYLEGQAGEWRMAEQASPFSNLSVDSAQLCVLTAQNFQVSLDILSQTNSYYPEFITQLSFPFCSVTFSTFDILQDEEVGHVCLQVQWC